MHALFPVHSDLVPLFRYSLLISYHKIITSFLIAYVKNNHGITVNEQKMTTVAAAIQGFKEEISIPCDGPWYPSMGMEERKSQVCTAPDGYRDAPV